MADMSGVLHILHQHRKNSKSSSYYKMYGQSIHVAKCKGILQKHKFTSSYRHNINGHSLRTDNSNRVKQAT